MKKKRTKNKKKKYYLILSKISGYRYGAFPHTPEGLNMAEKYLKKISDSDNDLHIVEK
ncbi:MAG: hypothetical protein H8E05_00905 [Bacteroidetes bacterium]|nr:hypothetical protein [Bacteroidota bacterium]